MARRVWVALLAVLLVVPAAQGLPTGTQDDAGSRGDAGDLPATATPVDPGNHTGELAGQVDEADYYAIDSPGAAMLRVSFDARVPLEVALVDPSGDVREESFHSEASGSLEAIGAPAGEWLLRIHLADGSSLYTSLPYSFSLEVEEHDHLTRIGGRVEARTIVQGFPNGTYTAITAEITRAPTPAEAPSAWSFYIEVAEHDGDFSFFGPGIVLSGGSTNEDVVWVRGPRSEGVDPGVVTPVQDPFRGRFTVFVDAFESPDDDYKHVILGTAGAPAVSVDGWVLSDEPPDLSRPPGTEATFRTIQGCADDGEGVQAGPYARVTAGTCQLEAETGTSAVLVDARAPPLATQPPDVVVDPPHADAEQVGGGAYFRSLYDFEKETLLPTGSWGVQVDHVDGWEGGRHRFVAASFPFENPLVRYNLTSGS